MTGSKLLKVHNIKRSTSLQQLKVIKLQVGKGGLPPLKMLLILC